MIQKGSERFPNEFDPQKGCSRLGASLVFFLTYQESQAEKIAEKAQPEQNKDQAAKTVETGSLDELMALFDKLN